MIRTLASTFNRKVGTSPFNRKVGASPFSRNVGPRCILGARNFSSSFPNQNQQKRIPIWARLTMILGLTGGSLFLIDRYYFKPVRDMFDPDEAKLIREALKLDMEAKKNGYDLPDASMDKLVRLYDELVKKRGSEVGLSGVSTIIAQKYDERQMDSNSLYWYKKAYPNLLDELDINFDILNQKSASLVLKVR
jgi:hypothetical protein